MSRHLLAVTSSPYNFPEPAERMNGVYDASMCVQFEPENCRLRKPNACAKDSSSACGPERPRPFLFELQGKDLKN